MQRQTLADWVAHENAPISADEIEAFYTRGNKPVGVLRVLRALECQLMRHPDDLARLTREYLAAAAAHHVRYAEFFWNPTGTGRLIPAIDREASPRDALEMVQWVVDAQRAHPRPEVVGIGIDYREVDRPPELFADAYALARRHGLKTTAHAGEFGMHWTNVQTCIKQLKVDRIDHGYTVVDKPEYARRCADAGIVFTVVPTNSYYLRTLPPERWALDHPIRRMPGLGLLIHPHTDDPTLHHVTPAQAWQKMHLDFGFDAQALRSFMHNGLRAAWVDEGTRQRWVAAFDAGFEAALQAENAPSGLRVGHQKAH